MESDRDRTDLSRNKREISFERPPLKTETSGRKGGMAEGHAGKRSSSAVDEGSLFVFNCVEFSS